MQIDYHDPVLLCRGLRKMAFVVCDNAADMIEDLQTQLAWAGAHQGGLETVLNGCYTEIAELRIEKERWKADAIALAEDLKDAAMAIEGEWNVNPYLATLAAHRLLVIEAQP